MIGGAIALFGHIVELSPVFSFTRSTGIACVHAGQAAE